MRTCIGVGTALALASFATGRASDKEMEFYFGPATGPKRPAAIWLRACPHQSSGRHRTAGCRILAANANFGRDCAVAVRLFAETWQRSGSGGVRICDPKIAAALASLSTPQKISTLRRERGFPGLELLALLVDSCFSRSKLPKAMACEHPRAKVGNLVLSSSRSSVPHPQHGGTASQPARRTYAYADLIPRHPQCGRAGLGKVSARRLRNHPRRSRGSCTNATRCATSTIPSRSPSPSLRGSRRSGTTRSTSATAVLMSRMPPAVSVGGGGAYKLSSIWRQPTAKDLRAASIITMPTGTRWSRNMHAPELKAPAGSRRICNGSPRRAPDLITIAARFGRVSWKYSSVAYSLILKDVGVLLQDAT